MNGAVASKRAPSPEEGDVALQVLGWIVCLGLLLILAPLAFFPLWVAFTTWQAFAIFAGAIVIAVVLHLLRVRRDVWYLAAGTAAAIAWIFALRLSEWDNEGRLNDNEEPVIEGLVIWLSIGGGLVAFVLGLAAAVRARRWWGRFGGIAIAIVGSLAATGVIWL